jgi:tetratricopeptide (TPR) repeat protein
MLHTGRHQVPLQGSVGQLTSRAPVWALTRRGRKGIGVTKAGGPPNRIISPDGGKLGFWSGAAGAPASRGQVRGEALMDLRRGCSAIALASLLAASFATPALTQQTRWEELSHQVDSLYKQARYSEAASAAQQALRVAEASFGPQDGNVATSLSALAKAYCAQARYAEAEPLLQRALAIREKASPPGSSELASSLNDLAEFYSVQARNAETVPLLQRTLAIQEKALGPSSLDVATTLSELAELNALPDAEPLLKRALEIRERALGPDHWQTVASLNDLARFYESRSRYAEAEPLLQGALAVGQKILGPNNPALAVSLSNLAGLYSMESRWPDAERLLKRALEIREKVPGMHYADLAVSQEALGNLYQTQGRDAKAGPLLKHALANLYRLLGPEYQERATRRTREEAKRNAAFGNGLPNLAPRLERPDLVTVLDERAEGCLRLGFSPRGQLPRDPLPASWQSQVGTHRAETAAGLSHLAELYSASGRYGGAELLWKHAIAISEEASGPDNVDLAASLTRLARVYSIRGRYREAEPLYSRALALAGKSFGPQSPQVAEILEEYSVVERGTNRDAVARELESRAKAIRLSQARQAPPAERVQSLAEEVAYDKYVKVTVPAGWTEEHSWELSPGALLRLYNHKLEAVVFIRGLDESELEPRGIEHLANGNDLTELLGFFGWPGLASRFGAFLSGGYSIQRRGDVTTVGPAEPPARIRYLGRMKAGPGKLEFVEWLSAVPLDDNLTKKLGLPPRFDGARAQILYGETAFGSLGASYRLVAARFTSSPEDLDWIKPVPAQIRPIPESEKARASKAVQGRELVQSAISDAKRGAYYKSLEQLRLALNLNPRDTNALTEKGSILVAQHEAQEAISILNQAIAIEPDHEMAHLNLALALWNLGKREEATKELETVRSMDPLFPPVDVIIQKLKAKQ